MLKFITNLFGGSVKTEKAPEAPCPYKVETTTAKAKKPTVKKATTRKPKTPKAPKA